MQKRIKQNSDPKISVVVPVLNNEKFIGQTLQSLVDQKYNNLEVIVQDGGSSDNTIKIARGFSKKLNLNIFSGKDNGQYDAINKGFKKATGDILAFLNSDDLYATNALQLIKQVYDKNPKALWFAGYGSVIDENGREIAKVVTKYKNLLLKINNYNLLIAVNYIMQPSVFLTRSAYDKYGPFLGNKKFLREYDMWFRLGKTQMPVIIPQTLSFFRLSKNMISASKFHEIARDDENTARNYSSNKFLIFLRGLHNRARALFLP